MNLEWGTRRGAGNGRRYPGGWDFFPLPEPGSRAGGRFNARRAGGVCQRIQGPPKSAGGLVA